METSKVVVDSHNEPAVAKWFRERGGIRVWTSANLSNPGAQWQTPMRQENGELYQKPSWQAAGAPRDVVDPSEVEVWDKVEVKRVKVAVRMSGNGLSMKLTDHSTQKVRDAVRAATAKSEKQAWYEFDYTEQQAVIYVEGGRRPLNLEAGR